MVAPHPLPRRVCGATDELPVHDSAATRRIETEALAQHKPHALMQRAGQGVARLALALAPHARRIWVAAGPGNNGGDGLAAATWLQRAGLSVRVSLAADAARLPADAAHALAQAHDAGVPVDTALPQDDADLAIDALLGLGSTRAVEGRLAEAIARLNRMPGPRLAVDLPTGLHADTGARLGNAAVVATHTLALLTLKPGLFTGVGRDLAGEVWLDALQTPADATLARMWLNAAPARVPRAHASHKGSYGDVAVVGGAPGMDGAARLAAMAALGAGAGRVYLSLLDGAAVAAPAELMQRARWWLGDPAQLARSTVVCGCGGGDAVGATLPPLLARAGRLVLDADALNALAADAALRTQLDARARRAQPTVLTPHPLEAARLLGTDSASVQRDRPAAVRELAARHGCVVLLKGSGSLIAAPDGRVLLNATGNALLATAGSGDVLAGWIGGLWAQQAGPDIDTAWRTTAAAAWCHGAAADQLLRQHPHQAAQRATQLIERMQCG